MDCGTPGLPVHRQLPEFTQTHSLWVSDAIHLILCCPLLLPSIFLSIRILKLFPQNWSQVPKRLRTAVLRHTPTLPASDPDLGCAVWSPDSNVFQDCIGPALRLSIFLLWKVNCYSHPKKSSENCQWREASWDVLASFLCAPVSHDGNKVIDRGPRI